MTRVLVYTHVPRTFPPVTGYGRHAVEVVTRLADRGDTRIEVLASAEFVGPDGRLDPRSPFARFPVRSFPLPERRAERWWKLLGRPRMDPYLGGVDVVYSPFDTYLPVRNRPWAVTLHDVMAIEPAVPWPRGWRHRASRAAWRVWGPAAVRAAAIVFTSTEFSKRRIIELLGADPDKVVVVGNGVDDRFYAAADLDPRTLPRPCPDPYLAMVGGLVPHKGGDVALRVADALRRARSPIRVVVAGRSDPGLAAAAGGHPNVILLGRIPDAELIPLIRGALALLFPSWYEGFGIPPLEAMAAGVPAIVSDRASLPEVVGEAGLVVSPDKPDEMADRAVWLDRHPSERAERAARGRAWSRRYSWESTADRVRVALGRLV
ncbi:MAG: glycosyltransferase family 1 protein [Gemmataceae bacterium]